ncbi:MAG: 1,4-alpha-glucan branching enzyme GlgB [Chlamydiales bacterium]|nr:1,4-alpha-glucan branching enzyme GlgB [Chlamydiales bacterium]
MGEEGHWYKEAIIYELHVKCFCDSSGNGYGDFKGLSEKLDYLQDLGVTAIWLLPFYPSPLKDDGYDIADYTDVHSLYGNLNDFKRFLREAHKRGLKVITELVINHTSDQHAWFQRARRAKKGSHFWNYYVWSDTPEKYEDARIIFQDFESSNWTWDPVAKSYYWHRFYSHQPDLNFEHPEVHKALLQKLSFWLKLGVDGVRLDAIPYLYEKEGTVCENLPETHAFLKKLRRYVDTHFENKMLLAEANQWPEEAANYFGEGDECHMAFHFPVMPRLFMSIHLEDSLPIIEIMEQTPHIPPSCQWALFLRNHDELTLEMVTDEERDYMFRVYAHDPQARVNLGIRRRLAPLLKNDRRKIELMNTLLFSLTGTPVVYYGDELGMGDNIYLGDRDGVRTPMQWSNDRNAGFSRANPQQLYLPPIIDPEYHYETLNVEAQLNNPHSLLWWTKQLISLRKRYKAFSYGTTEFLTTQNRKLLVFFRHYEDECLLIISNLSKFPQYVELDLQKYSGYSLVEMFSGHQFPKIGELPYFLTLGAHGYYWFSLKKESEKQQKDTIEIPTIAVQGEASNVFQPARRRMLEEALLRYLLRSRWLKPFLSQIDRTKTKLVDLLALSKHKMQCAFIEITLTSGVIHCFPLFLRYLDGAVADEKMRSSSERVVARLNGGILFDLMKEQEVADALASIISNRQKIRSEQGEIKGVVVTQVQDRVSNLEKRTHAACGDDGIRVFPIDQGVLKVFSCLEEGIDVDLEMRLFLTRHTHFRDFLPVWGYVEYRAPNHQAAVVLAEEVVSHSREFNAKELCIEAVDRFLMRMEASAVEHPQTLLPKRTLLELADGPLDTQMHRLLEEQVEVARLLGKETALLHQALSSQPHHPDFAPTPFTPFYQRSVYQTLRRKIREAFDRLRQLQNGKLSEEITLLLGWEERLNEKLQILPHCKIQAGRIRCHGNFILENLHYTGKEFFIANFEGNPQDTHSKRRYKGSPLIDCASLLLSFSEASFLAIDRLKARGVSPNDKWSLLWSLWVGSSFLRAYFHHLEEASFLPQNKQEIDFLLFVFLVEQCVEKIATAEHSHLEAPIMTLLHWLPIYESL